MAIREQLAAVLQDLDRVEAKALLVGSAITSAVAASGEAVKSLSAHSAQLGTIEGRAAAAQSSFTRIASEGASETEAAFGKMSARAGEILALAQETEAQVTGRVQAIASAAEDLTQNVATRLDDLQAKLQTEGNLWDQTLAALIEQVELGQISLQELLSRFGQARIEGQTILEFLGSMPFDVYERRLRQFIDQLRLGQRDLDSVLQLLAQSENAVAQQLLQTIELFRQGKVTIQAVLSLVQQIQKTFPDTLFSDLADAIFDSLRDGSLS